jgi:hypothetical protein
MSISSIISNISNICANIYTKEVQEEVEKTVEEQRDPMRSMGERAVDSVKDVLGLTQPEKEEYMGK